MHAAWIFITTITDVYSLVVQKSLKLHSSLACIRVYAQKRKEAHKCVFSKTKSLLHSFMGMNSSKEECSTS